MCRVPGCNSNPEGEISLSYIDWHVMDYYSPTFSKLYTSYQIKQLKWKFLTSGLKWILSSSACLLGPEMGVKTVCTFKIERKTRFIDYFSFQRTETKCN